MLNRGFKTVLIEGNIASGKTACLQYLTAHEKLKNLIMPVKEPMDKWRDVCGTNTLDLMYDDPSRWALTFQTYVQLTYMQAHSAVPSHPWKPVKVMERSLFSARHCFVENLRRTGHMPRIEYDILNLWFEWLCANHPAQLHVDLIVYLRTDPRTVLERLRGRSRIEEVGRVDLSYLQSVHECHEQWLLNSDDGSSNQTIQRIPILEINADQDQPSREAKYDVIVARIAEMAAETPPKTTNYVSSRPTAATQEQKGLSDHNDCCIIPSPTISQLLSHHSLLRRQDFIDKLRIGGHGGMNPLKA